MTEATNGFNKFEGSEGKNQDARTSALVGDMMICKSSNELFGGKSADVPSCLPSSKDLLAQLSETPHAPRCEAPTHEKRGPIDVTVDEHGEMFAVKDNQGNTFTKNSDGKWTKHSEVGNYKTDEIIDNLKVDCNGNMSYDYNNKEKNVHVHYDFNADGSWSCVNEFGKFAYDKDVNLVEAPAGEGHSRKFHYTNGQLDQIDGRLGHWDRLQKDGQVSWVNKNTGAVWQGDFRLNTNMLEFNGQNGAAWTFTPWGTDINRASQNEQLFGN